MNLTRLLQMRNWHDMTVEQVIDMPYVLKMCHTFYLATFDRFLDAFTPVVERSHW